ncbi:MAG: NAD+ synthase [Candidatus Dormibacteraeota bacterium]|nr:NAD+ synthase [Candidatus Dormibacteraeota bacterium]
MQRAIASGTAALELDAALVTELLCGFIAAEVRKTGFGDVVVGLSGGVDSSLVAALAARSLGPEHVAPILMPYRTSDPRSEADARRLCDAFALQPLLIDITPQVDAYFDRHPDADRRRRGNKMARERMTVLFDQSAARDALVLGTSNKTEMLIGYSTLFGDQASALNPIGDLYKTQVFQLARAVGVPDSIVSKPPSADLWAGQSDEEEMGLDYATLDAILYHLVDERRTRDELAALGFDDAVVDEISRRVRTSQFKRRPPLIAKLGPRTIDREFRYPRDWGL